MEKALIVSLRIRNLEGQASLDRHLFKIIVVIKNMDELSLKPYK